MNRRYLLLALIAIGAVGLAWFVAAGRSSSNTQARAQGAKPPDESSTAPGKGSKPICSSVIVPAGTDCIPQHLANLPPDPGPQGMKTIEGIDSDKDGVRDDVQRFIVLNWGHSERAVRALMMLAKELQLRVVVGGETTPEKAREAGKILSNLVSCYWRSVSPEIRNGQALDLVSIEITNTPERYLRKGAFEVKATGVYDLPTAPVTELCGYDPAMLPN